MAAEISILTAAILSLPEPPPAPFASLFVITREWRGCRESSWTIWSTPLMQLGGYKCKSSPSPLSV